MAAKWWPNTIHLLVGSKSWPLRRRSAGVARVSSSAMTRAAMNRRVEAVAEEVGAGGGEHQPDAVDRLAARQRDAGEAVGRADRHRESRERVRASSPWSLSLVRGPPCPLCGVMRRQLLADSRPRLRAQVRMREANRCEAGRAEWSSRRRAAAQPGRDGMSRGGGGPGFSRADTERDLRLAKWRSPHQRAQQPRRRSRPGRCSRAARTAARRRRSR